jgi:hypothetical protein
MQDLCSKLLNSVPAGDAAATAVGRDEVLVGSVVQVQLGVERRV